MKVKLFFSRWSRTIHRWVGLYFALIVLIYVSESFLLPALFSEGLPAVNYLPEIA